MPSIRRQLTAEGKPTNISSNNCSRRLPPTCQNCPVSVHIGGERGKGLGKGERRTFCVSTSRKKSLWKSRVWERCLRRARKPRPAAQPQNAPMTLSDGAGQHRANQLGFIEQTYRYDCHCFAVWPPCQSSIPHTGGLPLPHCRRDD